MQHTSCIGSRPLWFRAKYARPVRKVVSRVRRYYRNAGYRDWSYTQYDVLECGHQLEDAAHITGDKPARHRRCRQCPTKDSSHDME